jgi:hypothetical protein
MRATSIDPETEVPRTVPPVRAEQAYACSGGFCRIQQPVCGSESLSTTGVAMSSGRTGVMF